MMSSIPLVTMSHMSNKKQISFGSWVALELVKVKSLFMYQFLFNLAGLFYLFNLSKDLQSPSQALISISHNTGIKKRIKEYPSLASNFITVQCLIAYSQTTWGCYLIRCHKISWLGLICILMEELMISPCGVSNSICDSLPSESVLLNLELGRSGYQMTCKIMLLITFGY